MEYLNDRNIARALVAAVLVSIGLAALALSGVFSKHEVAREITYETAGAALELVRFSDLDGWLLDDAAETLPAFLRSCARLALLPDEAPINPEERLGEGVPLGATLSGSARDWRQPCDAAAKVAAQRYTDANARTSAARALYQFHFRPVRILERLKPTDGSPPDASEKLSATGRFTGYFEPFYPASAARTAVYSAAVYARPDDLVTADLGKFRPELAGQRIAGRLIDGALDPYPDHAAINAGAISARARVLAFMKPTDLFFLQIQGSGRAFIGGKTVRLAYDGGNGQPYTAIGGTLIGEGALTRETVSMQTIRDWLDKAPAAEARRVREMNQSFVFFRVMETLPDPALGPPGSAGVQLTPGRSLAVDQRFTPLGAPVWISIPGDAAGGKAPMRRLLIAQDSGGAIKGPVRGDIFVGSGVDAGEVAGVFNETGEMIVLVPAPLAERLAARR